MDNKETMLEAFLRQTGMEPGSFEQSEEHGKLYGEAIGDRKGEGHIAKIEQDKMFYEQAGKMYMDKPISNYVEIPSQINSEDLNQKTQVSPQFKDYDHSLEKNRWKEIGGSDTDDGIIMEEMD